MTRRSVRGSPATSAGAPATPRSSRRSHAPQEEPTDDAEPRPDRRSHERQGAASRRHATRPAPRRAADGRAAAGGQRERPGASGRRLSQAARHRVRDRRLARPARPRPVSDPTGSLRSMPVEPPVPSPRDLAEAYASLAEAPARPIAGGTDLMVALTGEIGEPPDRILDLWGLDELRGINLDGDAISLGALTTYTEVRRSALCGEHLPVLVEAAATMAAPKIQTRGPLGGNVATAPPAGDTLPVFLASD